MLHDSVKIGSVEELLGPEHIAHLSARIAQELGNGAAFDVTGRKRSVHSLAGEDLARVKEVYEPRGRIEYDELPVDITELLDSAVDRRMDELRRVFPSARRSMDWLYVEYGAGQYVTPHIDYPFNEIAPERPKVAAIGIVLSEADSGGEFFVETGGGGSLWNEDGSVKENATLHSPWFAAMRRTRWRVTCRAGDALCWGTQLVHGTEPVTSGRTGKFIGFLGS
ncbi:phytanoyl-CoA dioxygenase family protein [Streptomyces sp. AV19]|uniref:phytanoyl-CoA dioxygenase family protein n=1 Tax=Streptomyces sp. AV19 TaxID=2793068 RepID=UPI0018FEC33E|nr:phytanoyl-CoA dioxygenase family protein [Streptomyces sp. AV19]MBH1937471.1 phytanoyl-CoA dioxygenase family protein [Streptomyces sp. AV19]MDG4533756.1 phytanoyl-CoA dioxygenase family protein [Streptomyces sp. AV19]